MCLPRDADATSRALPVPTADGAALSSARRPPGSGWSGDRVVYTMRS